MKTNVIGKFLIVGVLSLSLGILVGLHIRANHISVHQTGQLRADVGTFKYVNPLLLSSVDVTRSAVFDPLVKHIQSEIDGYLQRDRARAVSVYVRELNTGRWSGVNEDETYIPSSMLKVVTMMAVLKLAEKDPLILSKKIYYQPDESTKRYRPNDTVTAGSYSMRDLVYNMIVYSDNASNKALLSDADINTSFNFVYGLFLLPRNYLASESPDFMSAKSVSAIFRVLYNSTLFQWQLSEQVLELLSKTTFDKGLVAGVPQGTIVSHKFGEAAFESIQGSDVRELHDCGILYLPQNPYLLCVMTKGEKIEDLEAVIARISKLSWDFMSNLNK